MFLLHLYADEQNCLLEVARTLIFPNSVLLWHIICIINAFSRNRELQMDSSRISGLDAIEGVNVTAALARRVSNYTELGSETTLISSANGDQKFTKLQWGV